MTEHCKRWLVGFAAAYVALLPTNHGTFLRSVAFGGLAACALALVVLAWRERRVRIPRPDLAVLAPVALWALWSIASWTWSERPRYTAGQLAREVVDSSVVVASMYVAALDAKAFRTIVVAILASFALLAMLALALWMSPAGWDPGRWHHGVGPWSTFVVLVAPWLFLLLAGPPAGLATRRRGMIIALALLALMVGTGRLTDNRMIWIALAAVFAVGAVAGALRWPKRFGDSSWRWLAPLAAALLVCGLAFLDTAEEKAERDFPPSTSVTQTLEHDPRLALWQSTVAKIRERPWTGYGFGRRIIAGDLVEELRDPLLAHAHNLFASQALQSGLPGAVLFAAILVVLALRFRRYIRSGDDTLALVGVVGLAVVAGFVVKNLTDDFLFRSNAKEFWAYFALLVGYGTRLERAMEETSGSPPAGAVDVAPTPDTARSAAADAVRET